MQSVLDCISGIGYVGWGGDENVQNSCWKAHSYIIRVRRSGDAMGVLGLLGTDRDCLFAAVAELKGNSAVDVDGAFIEQSYAEVWAEDQMFKIKIGDLLRVVVVGGQSVALVLDLGDHGSMLS